MCGDAVECHNQGQAIFVFLLHGSESCDLFVGTTKFGMHFLFPFSISSSFLAVKSWGESVYILLHLASFSLLLLWVIIPLCYQQSNSWNRVSRPIWAFSISALTLASASTVAFSSLSLAYKSSGMCTGSWQHFFEDISLSCVRW